MTFFLSIRRKKRTLLAHRCDWEPVPLESGMGVAPMGEQGANVKKTQ